LRSFILCSESEHGGRGKGKESGEATWSVIDSGRLHFLVLVIASVCLVIFVIFGFRVSVDVFTSHVYNALPVLSGVGGGSGGGAGMRFSLGALSGSLGLGCVLIVSNTVPLLCVCASVLIVTELSPSLCLSVFGFVLSLS
jgi:hypothetical protein